MYTEVLKCQRVKSDAIRTNLTKLVHACFVNCLDKKCMYFWHWKSLMPLTHDLITTYPISCFLWAETNILSQVRAVSREYLISLQTGLHVKDAYRSRDRRSVLWNRMCNQGGTIHYFYELEKKCIISIDIFVFKCRNMRKDTILKNSHNSERNPTTGLGIIFQLKLLKDLNIHI